MFYATEFFDPIYPPNIYRFTVATPTDDYLSGLSQGSHEHL